MKKLFISLVFCLVALSAQSSEKINVCAEYTKTGSKYKVNATFISGSELNSATRTLNYTSFSKYIVIFWSDGQATIIELSMPFLNAVGTDGVDQQGHNWNVSTLTSMCF